MSKLEKNDNTIFDNHILTSSRENHILIFGLISLIQTLFLSSFIFFAAISNSSTNFLFSVAALFNAFPLATIACTSAPASSALSQHSATSRSRSLIVAFIASTCCRTFPISSVSLSFVFSFSDKAFSFLFSARIYFRLLEDARQDLRNLSVNAMS